MFCLAVAADGCAMNAAYSRKERLNDSGEAREESPVATIVTQA